MIVSVIIPAHNEPKTLKIVLNRLQALRIPDVELEVIVVATIWPSDETFKIAARHPFVAAVAGEEYPRGKGAAVRLGLLGVTGEIVLIQDADLEYDVEDYESLLAPIIAGKADFVLGSRVAQTFGLRQFADAPLKAKMMNFGHRLFAFALNMILGTRMQDPFTMFKVFRRNCIKGMKFRCNRFDFDFELVSKLVRAGYVPTEIPVSYKSRSFSEGKKIRMVQDPLSWCWFLLKLLVRAI